MIQEITFVGDVLAITARENTSNLGLSAMRTCCNWIYVVLYYKRENAFPEKIRILYRPLFVTANCSSFDYYLLN